MALNATDTEVQLPINAIFQSTFLRRAIPLSTYFVGTKSTNLERQGGSDFAKWRRVTGVSASVTALSEQTGNAAFFGGRTGATVSMTDVTAQVSKYGQVIPVTEEVEAFNPSGTIDEITASLGTTAGQSLNQLQRNIAEDNLTAVRANAASSTGAITSGVVRSEIDQIVNTLLRNDTKVFMPMATGDDTVGSSPIAPAFIGITHFDVVFDLENLAGWIPVQSYAGHTRTFQGEVGMLPSSGFGVRFVASSDATIDADAGGTKGTTGLRGTSDVDIYTTVIYGQDCLGSVGLGMTHPDGAYMAEDTGSMPNSIELIIKGFEGTGTSDPFNEIKTIAYKFWHGGAVLNSNFGRAYLSGATAL